MDAYSIFPQATRILKPNYILPTATRTVASASLSLHSSAALPNMACLCIFNAFALRLHHHLTEVKYDSLKKIQGTYAIATALVMDNLKNQIKIKS